MVGEAVRMLLMRLQGHQVDHIHHPDLEVGDMLAEEADRGQRLQCRHIAGAGHHDVGLSAPVVAGPFPDADPRGAVLDGVVHVEPLRGRLLARDDHVDPVPAALATKRLAA